MRLENLYVPVKPVICLKKVSYGYCYSLACSDWLSIFTCTGRLLRVLSAGNSANAASWYKCSYAGFRFFSAFPSPAYGYNGDSRNNYLDDSQENTARKFERIHKNLMNWIPVFLKVVFFGSFSVSEILSFPSEHNETVDNLLKEKLSENKWNNLNWLA